ncbi:hypothetical protein JAO76_04475 [Pontibacter sp. BT310]|uniref:STAS/SEC14 domain-containing protein n=1 Tax=Pontibacter populi TaxID=890055 RepID=A0ABS6X9E0_9BACT|nr:MULTISPECIES: hypothetical protein [Pontibacter]MBJ6117431.1 hypothetical protein [Pontibacter sp. BT310]MBR0569856.1 hypothetical protein [Microvirga sp. STS03]MBW3364284.1 hypothetical protein [Pontibacter populi]
MEVSLMELAYDDIRNVLSVKWSDELSVESAQFFETIISLFATIRQKQVINLVVDSGIPAGGLLTEEIIEYFIQQIPSTPLRNIAIMESPDYLWDNNLYQVIALLVATYKLPIAVKLVKNRSGALQWFSRL